MQPKLLKRPADDLDNDGFEPTPAKAARNGPGGPGGPGPPPQQQQQQQQQHQSQQQQQGEALTKFSVEIVQQLEFTTSAASAQPQQISTNVTVKALTNTSVKSDVRHPGGPSPAGAGGPQGPQGQQGPQGGAPQSQQGQQGNGPGSGPQTPRTPRTPSGGPLVECKQEPGLGEDFVDLEQCAAALEKDAQVGTASAASPRAVPLCAP